MASKKAQATMDEVARIVAAAIGDADRERIAKASVRRKAARARHWRRTGVSEATVNWMKERDML